ncbi:MAG: DUF4292 domain-containing protein [Chlorobium limicola]|uniref:DUF4292 domain-containing protein n=1 Tax=Chlorobium limicola (strain DSM 245 / NBRC 103803 / 6330) TaxID=290315 RepID=B3EC91_CHLL2|nr:DUF4292 domain-containing protein [Chlorobium limicola]ACD90166.1 conserved hypothetical protein [Chlorobium limicola DSM 245]NTV20010.1 DUF4292 domain-containing protein [Chlorobium limicola]
MMNRIVTLFLVVFFFFLQYGCADFETVIRDEVPDRPTVLTRELADLYREVAGASPLVRSLDGYADITIKTPRRKERVYCNIQLVRYRESRMIVSAGLLGWPVADLYFGKDSLYVHDMLNNRLLAGRNSEENLEKILGVPSGYRLLSESLLGLVNLDEAVEDVSSVKKGEGRVLYVFEKNRIRKEMVIDSENRTLTSLVIRNGPGELSTTLYFRNFKPYRLENKVMLIPQQIEMVLSRTGDLQENAYRLLIDYDKRVINPEALSIKFARPRNARLINFDDIGVLPWL